MAKQKTEISVPHEYLKYKSNYFDSLVTSKHSAISICFDWLNQLSYLHWFQRRRWRHLSSTADCCRRPVLTPVRTVEWSATTTAYWLDLMTSLWRQARGYRPLAAGEPVPTLTRIVASESLRRRCLQAIHRRVRLAANDASWPRRQYPLAHTTQSPLSMCRSERPSH